MFKKAKTLIQTNLKQGLSVSGIAKALAAGVICGTFPLLGFTTGLGLIVGSVFKLNHPLLQLVNHLLGAVQLILIPVYISIGEWIFHADPVSLNIKVMLHEFSTDLMLFLKDYGQAGIYAIFAWALLSIPVGLLVYWISKYFLSKTKIERVSS